MRHFDAVPVVHSTSRPIARLAVPFAATNTMRARCRSRSSVLVERALSFVAKITAIASGMPSTRQ